VDRFSVSTDSRAIAEEIRNYLKPKNGRPAHRAHLFTINGFTYSLIRDFGFACVPDPPETSLQASKRRFSILAYLFGTRPGDLMFFFQGDPQHPKDDIESRRGFRGIYRVTSAPFRDTTELRHQQTGYKICGKCPSCRKPFGGAAKKCKACGRPYPEVAVRAIYRNRPPGGVDFFRVHVLPARLLIEPLVIFARVLGDNRAYMDMEDPGLIWISRADNAMGPGKGSSIRHLLPEEAVKITRLLLKEPGQEIIGLAPSPYPSSVRDPIRNEDLTEAVYPRLKGRRDYVEHEFHLNLHVARTLDIQGSSIQQALGNVLNTHELEYWGSELPWGYTGGTADFVCAFRGPEGRYRIIILEFKNTNIDDTSLVQVMLYVPWVTQVCTQFAEPHISKIEVVPVIVGRRNRLSSVPAGYSYDTKYLVGPQKRVEVCSPRVIEYEPIDIFANPDSKTRYAKDLLYTDVTHQIKRKIKWTPPPGLSTSMVDREFALEDWGARQRCRQFEINPNWKDANL